jgi:PhnB protein
MMNVTPHLNFRGNARAALEFYQMATNGHLLLVTYQDAHNVQDPAEAHQVMFGQVTAPNGFRIMAYDVPSRLPWDQGQTAFFVSSRSTDTAEIQALWEGLSPDAHVVQPLGPSGWTPLYGMLQDRFGVTWVLDVEVPYQG